jgi:predicted nucleic acid-binding protein
VAAVATHLVDTSCLARLRNPLVAQVVVPLVEAGLVAGCDMTEVEMLWSTRTPAQFDRLREQWRALEHLPIEPEDWRRALEVQRELWHRGKQRAVGLPDLLVAAVAECHTLVVLHYDRDYDLVAAVTGQRTAWVVPPGSVP